MITLSFALSYVVNPQAVKELPKNLFSTKSEQFIKGKIVNVPGTAGSPTGPSYPTFDPIHSIEDIYTVDFDGELTGISISASGYASPDCWDLYLDDTKILETIFMKNVAEEFKFDVVIPIPKDSKLKLVFYNGSGTQKVIWYNLKFVK